MRIIKSLQSVVVSILISLSCSLSAMESRLDGSTHPSPLINGQGESSLFIEGIQIINEDLLNKIIQEQKEQLQNERYKVKEVFYERNDKCVLGPKERFSIANAYQHIAQLRIVQQAIEQGAATIDDSEITSFSTKLQLDKKQLIDHIESVAAEITQTNNTGLNVKKKYLEKVLQQLKETEIATYGEELPSLSAHNYEVYSSYRRFAKYYYIGATVIVTVGVLTYIYKPHKRFSKKCSGAGTVIKVGARKIAIYTMHTLGGIGGTCLLALGGAALKMADRLKAKTDSMSFPQSEHSNIFTPTFKK